MARNKLPVIALAVLMVSVGAIAFMNSNSADEVADDRMSLSAQFDSAPRLSDGDSAGFMLNGTGRDAYDLAKIFLGDLSDSEKATVGDYAEKMGMDMLYGPFLSSASYDDYIQSLGAGFVDADLSLSSAFQANATETDAGVSLHIVGSAELIMAITMSPNGDEVILVGFEDGEVPYSTVTLTADVSLDAVCLFVDGMVKGFEINLRLCVGEKDVSCFDEDWNGYRTVTKSEEHTAYHSSSINDFFIKFDQEGVDSLDELGMILDGTYSEKVKYGLTTALESNVHTVTDYGGDSTTYYGSSSVESTTMSAEQMSQIAAMTKGVYDGEGDVYESVVSGQPMIPVLRAIAFDPGYRTISPVMGSMGINISEDGFIRLIEVLKSMKTQAYDFNSTASCFQGYAKIGALNIHGSLQQTIGEKVAGISLDVSPQFDGNYEFYGNPVGDEIALRFTYAPPVEPMEVGDKIGPYTVSEVRNDTYGGSGSQSFEDTYYSEYLALGDSAPKYISRMVIDCAPEGVVVIDADVGTLTTDKGRFNITELYSLTVTGSVGTIGYDAFRDATNLQYVDIHDVGTIESFAFAGCLSLSKYIESFSISEFAESFAGAEEMEGFALPAFESAYVGEVYDLSSVRTVGDVSYEVHFQSFDDEDDAWSTASAQCTRVDGMYGCTNSYISYPDDGYGAVVAYGDSGAIYVSFCYSNGKVVTFGDMCMEVEGTVLYDDTSNISTTVCDTLEEAYAAAHHRDVNPDWKVSFGKIGTLEYDVLSTLDTEVAIEIFYNADNTEVGSFGDQFWCFDSEKNMSFYPYREDGRTLAYVDLYGSSVPASVSSSDNSFNDVPIPVGSVYVGAVPTNGIVDIYDGVVYSFGWSWNAHESPVFRIVGENALYEIKDAGDMTLLVSKIDGSVLSLGVPEVGSTPKTVIFPEGITSFSGYIPESVTSVVASDTIRYFNGYCDSVLGKFTIGANVQYFSGPFSSFEVSEDNPHYKVVESGGLNLLVHNGNSIDGVWGSAKTFTVPAPMSALYVSQIADNVEELIIPDHVFHVSGTIDEESTITSISIGAGVRSSDLYITKEGIDLTLSENLENGSYVSDGKYYLCNRLIYLSDSAGKIVYVDEGTSVADFKDGFVYVLPIGSNVQYCPRLDNSNYAIGWTTFTNQYYNTSGFKLSSNYLYNDFGIEKINGQTRIACVGDVTLADNTLEVVVRSSHPELFGITGSCNSGNAEITPLGSGGFKATVDIEDGMPYVSVSVNVVPVAHKVTFMMNDHQYVVEDFSILNRVFPENTGNLANISGLVFVGWYEDDGYTVPYDGTYDADQSTYYAKYVPYTDFFIVDSNKGTITTPAFADDCILIPEVVAKDGYTFIGWNYAGVTLPSDVDRVPVDVPARGQSMKAMFVNSSEYTVTYMVGDEVYKTSTEAYGDIILTPRASDVGGFSYWVLDGEKSGRLRVVTDDMVFTAVTLHKVTWKNYDGTVLYELPDVMIGDEPVYAGEAPVRAADAQYTYTFSGWDPAMGAISGDATYTAQYTTVLNEYTVTWKNYDGTVLKTEKVAYGTVPEYAGDAPAKESTADAEYKFSTWFPEIAAVSGDATYTAQYTTIDLYTAIWKNYDGTVLYQKAGLKAGDEPVYAGETPVRAADVQYTYTFSGWDPAMGAISGDVTYTAQYTTVLNEYTVTWKNYDGSVLKTAKVAYGTVPEYSGETPARAADVQYAYTFSGWNPEVVSVSGNTAYTAAYTSVVNEYEIVFEAGEADSETFTLAYGAVIVAPADPKAPEGKTFVKWEGFVSGMTVIGAAVFKAVYGEDYSKTTDGTKTITEYVDESGANVKTVDDTSTGTSITTTVTEEENKKTSVEVVSDLEGNTLGSTETVSETVTEGSTVTKTETSTLKDSDGNMTSIVKDVNIKSDDMETVAKIETDAQNKSTVTSTTTVDASSDNGSVAVSDDTIADALADLSKASEGVEAETKDVKVVIKSDDRSSARASTSVSKDALSKVSDAGASLALDAGVGSVSIDSAVSKTLAESSSDGDVSLSIRLADKGTMTDKQRSVVRDSTVVELSASVGSTAIHQLGGKATITIPYVLKAWENEDNICVWYVDSDGRFFMADDVSYSALNGGSVTFSTTHFSMFVISTESNLGSAESTNDDSWIMPVIVACAVALVFVAFAAVSAIIERHH